MKMPKFAHPLFVTLALTFGTAFTASANPPGAAMKAAAVIGITPESIVIADLGQDLTAIAIRIVEEGDLMNQLALTKEQIDILEREAATLAAQIQASEDAANEIRDDYDDALAALATAREAAALTQYQLFQAATVGLPQQKITALLAWREAARHRMPASFRALSRTTDQWEQIEMALRAEAYSLRHSVPLEVEYAEALVAIRSNPVVMMAAVRIETQLVAVRMAFLQSLM